MEFNYFASIYIIGLCILCQDRLSRFNPMHYTDSLLLHHILYATTALFLVFYIFICYMLCYTFICFLSVFYILFNIITVIVHAISAVMDCVCCDTYWEGVWLHLRLFCGLNIYFSQLWNSQHQQRILGWHFCLYTVLTS